MANEHHHAKFHAGRSCRCRDMAVFRLFKMEAVRQLGFLIHGIFNCLYPSEGQYASSCQISRRSVKPLQRFGRIVDFSRWRSSAILDLLYACSDHPHLVVFVTVQSFVWINAVVSITCKFTILSVRLENAYSLGCFGVKIWEIRTFCSSISLGMQ